MIQDNKNGEVNNVDELFHKKLYNYSMSSPDSVWEKIDKKRTPIFITWNYLKVHYKTSLSVFLVLVLSSSFFIFKDRFIPDNEVLITQKDISSNINEKNNPNHLRKINYAAPHTDTENNAGIISENKIVKTNKGQKTISSPTINTTVAKSSVIKTNRFERNPVTLSSETKIDPTNKTNNQVKTLESKNNDSENRSENEVIHSNEPSNNQKDENKNTSFVSKDKYIPNDNSSNILNDLDDEKSLNKSPLDSPGQLIIDEIKTVKIDTGNLDTIIGIDRPPIKEKQKRLSIDVFVSLNPYVSKTLEEKSNLKDDYNDYKEARMNSENMKFSSGGGIRVSYEVFDNIYIRSGIIYSQINEELKFESHDKITTINSRDAKIVDPFNSSREITVYDTTISPNDVFITSDNVYTFIDFPLILGYSIASKKFDISFNLGVTYNIIFKHEGQILSTVDNEAINISESSNDNPFKNSSGLGLIIGLGFNYNLSDKIQVIIEPTYKKYGSITNSSYPLDQDFNSMGLLVGFRYKL